MSISGLEIIENLIAKGIRKGDWFSYLFCNLNRKVTDKDDVTAYVKLNLRKKQYYLVVNPDKILEISRKAQTDFESTLKAILSHELFHLMQNHVQRGFEIRTKPMVLNVAADFAVNTMLKSDEQALLRETGGVFPDQFEFPAELSMEQYVSLLKKMPQDPESNNLKLSVENGKPDKNQDKQSGNSSHSMQNDIIQGIKDLEEQQANGEDMDEDNNPISVSTASQEAADDFKKTIKKTFENNKDKIKRSSISGTFEELLEWAVESQKLPWNELLRRNIMSNATKSRERYKTYSRLSRRPINGLVRKGEKFKNGHTAMVILDTSGSMSTEDFVKFNGVLESMNKHNIDGYVVQWDYNSINEKPITINAYLKKDYHIRGRGGTSMVNGVNYVYQRFPELCDQIIVVTDGGTDFFDKGNEAPTDVIWFITGKYPVPDNIDGRVVRLDG